MAEAPPSYTRLIAAIQPSVSAQQKRERGCSPTHVEKHVLSAALRCLPAGGGEMQRFIVISCCGAAMRAEDNGEAEAAEVVMAELARCMENISK
jgi:hypothetical protein